MYPYGQCYKYNNPSWWATSGLPMPYNQSSNANAGMRHTWLPPLWSFLEQTPLAQAYNYSYSWHESPNCKSDKTGASNAALTFYSCPSDRVGGTVEAYGGYARGNYVVNFGHDRAYNYTLPPPCKHKVLSWEGEAPFAPNKWYGLNDITDGLSNTMFWSELKQAPDSSTDLRGTPLDTSCSYYTTEAGPNTSTQDVCHCVYNIPDMPSSGSDVTNGTLIRISARSYHSNGVNAALGDGGVRFVTNTISLNVWIAIGSAKGGESNTSF
jgi:hypothetical protein